MIRVFVIDPRQSTGSVGFVDAILGTAQNGAAKSVMPYALAPTLLSKNSTDSPDSDQSVQNRDDAIQVAVQ